MRLVYNYWMVQRFTPENVSRRIQRQGRGGAEKHEIYAAAFGGHHFYDLFWQDWEWGRHGPLPDPLLVPEYPFMLACLMNYFPQTHWLPLTSKEKQKKMFVRKKNSANLDWHVIETDMFISCSAMLPN